ncbi:MAG: hypothetical protein MZV63_26835 [Marinilabiliales bacterium]|nr:hypothetical protein [Marinilabiliales bacterium]
MNENMETFAPIAKKQRKTDYCSSKSQIHLMQNTTKNFGLLTMCRATSGILHPKQMKQLGEKHGFKLASLHTMPFDSFYVAMLSEKYKKSKLALFKGIFFGKISWLNSIFNHAKMQFGDLCF